MIIVLWYARYRSTPSAAAVDGGAGRDGDSASVRRCWPLTPLGSPQWLLPVHFGLSFGGDVADWMVTIGTAVVVVRVSVAADALTFSAIGLTVGDVAAHRMPPTGGRGGRGGRSVAFAVVRGVLLPVAEHTVLEGESAIANVTLERSLAGSGVPVAVFLFIAILCQLLHTRLLVTG
uniref:Uncharacterized protein n=1 Tax=Anopheles maculatus TaxID=74869 RepID=A0A182T3B8_9DIPT